MLTKRDFFLALGVSVWLLGVLGTAEDFTVIALPDTQNEAQFFPQVLASQTKWIVNNRQSLNIGVVLEEGDIVNDGASVAQQQNADAVSFIQAYVDGDAAFTEKGGTLDTSLSMRPGTYRLTVQAKDGAGVVFKQTILHYGAMTARVAKC